MLDRQRSASASSGAMNRLVTAALVVVNLALVSTGGWMLAMVWNSKSLSLAIGSSDAGVGIWIATAMPWVAVGAALFVAGWTGLILSLTRRPA
jgi:hypothetical protein